MLKISDETRNRIESGLVNWNDSNSDARKRFEASQKYWDRVFEPLKKAFEDSERLTEYDYNIRVTPCDYF